MRKTEDKTKYDQVKENAGIASYKKLRRLPWTGLNYVNYTDNRLYPILKKF